MEKREIYIAWIIKTVELETGEEYFIPVEEKAEQKRFIKGIQAELKIMEGLDSLKASQVHVYTTFKDKRLWVVLRKTSVSPFVGFKKSADGTIDKVLLDISSEKLRRLALMVEDGLTLEEIVEAEDGLTKDEMTYVRSKEILP